VTSDSLEMLGMRRLQHVPAIYMIGDWGTQHLEKLFQALVRLTRLRSIVGLNGNNLSCIEPGLLASVVNRMERLWFAKVNLTKKQVQTIFSAMCRDTKLKELYIPGNNLSTVQPDTLATAVNLLETVDMRSTQLTPQQITAVLAQALHGTVLQSLSLSYRERHGHGLEPQVLEQARQKIKYLYIYYQVGGEPGSVQLCKPTYYGQVNYGGEII